MKKPNNPVSPKEGETNWEKAFDEKFHKRVWSIVKQINPSSYAEAEAFRLLEGEGPQIYGEIKDFIRNQIKETREKTLQEIQSYNVAFCSKCKGLFKAVHKQCFLKESDGRDIQKSEAERKD